MKDALQILDNIRRKDKNIIAVFIHGSFVSSTTSSKNYQEVRVFDGNKFLFSKFNLLNIHPDIDVIYVSRDPEQSKIIIDEESKNLAEGYFLTINLMTKEIFEREAVTEEPRAIKMILQYRELVVIKGKDYIEEIKLKAKDKVQLLDRQFQDEFDCRKSMLKAFAKYDRKEIVLYKEQYESFFPLFYQMLTGKLNIGFPEDRYKLVYPGPMNLKLTLDIQKTEVKALR